MNLGIVSTISDRCKICYSCIRECPAKAIKVVSGQAAVISERCIVCGHCVKVCSQHAKQILSDIPAVFHFLAEAETIALIAPSFVASFPDDYSKFPTALRKLGFKKIVETAFGADLISDYYVKEMRTETKRTIISSACPAVVNYIEKYRKELVPNLAKVVSPMIAAARYMKKTSPGDIKIVFIGPCIAKKNEFLDNEVSGVIDAVLTFGEIKKMFKEKNMILSDLEEGDLDPPHAYLGRAYPLAGGLLKTAEISGDILEKEIIVVEGKKKVLEIIDEIAENKINAKFVDILFCEGCISGPAIDSDLNYYSRREKVIKYIEQKIHLTDKQLWKSNIYNSRNINFSRSFSSKNQRKVDPAEEIIKEILAETNKLSPQDELNCGACGYSTCREYAVAIGKGLAEKEMCLPFLIDKLKQAYNDLNSTQEQLRTAEKLASIGQLAAGVAHEINNPLGTILLYSSMLEKELQGDEQRKEDLKLIIEEAGRCKNIVSNLLNFARQGKLQIKKINMLSLLSKIIRTVKLNPEFKDISVKIGKSIPDCSIEADEDQLSQVFINLLNNACEAMIESSEKILTIKIYKEEQAGGAAATDYLIVEIKDTGAGIPKENFGKIFTPFFTTKKIGKGTGLGLAISYGIIKMHKGSIAFQSEAGKGTAFKLKLPRKIKNSELSLNTDELKEYKNAG
ncbi:MAG TPA: [Fe-Fe] hydrogenase large subunit C-terminal domain-containing protein [Ignavibacteriaceae bacterium]|nr:[Fe-Fe] hydrogenase large subunit C-terminal domain-containing protein [Ignavibacteriaceae bacterium]